MAWSHIVCFGRCWDCCLLNTFLCCLNSSGMPSVPSLGSSRSCFGRNVMSEVSAEPDVGAPVYVGPRVHMYIES